MWVLINLNIKVLNCHFVLIRICHWNQISANWALMTLSVSVTESWVCIHFVKIKCFELQSKVNYIITFINCINNLNFQSLKLRTKRLRNPAFHHMYCTVVHLPTCLIRFGLCSNQWVTAGCSTCFTRLKFDHFKSYQMV